MDEINNAINNLILSAYSSGYKRGVFTVLTMVSEMFQEKNAELAKYFLKLRDTIMQSLNEIEKNEIEAELNE